MFEAANNMTMNTQGGGSVQPSQSVVTLKPVEKPVEKEETSTQNAIAMKLAQQKETAERRAEEKRQVTEEMLDELEQDIENMHNVGLRFSKHNDSGRTMIKVLDKENDQVIREIPAEDVLNLAAKMEEMIGILFDKEV
jgi:flagellar protein FlaG